MQPLVSLEVEGFGRFGEPWELELSPGLNLLVGENDTGKTQLLKLLYAVTRSAEDYWRKRGGPQPRKYGELLLDKLLWTFLPGGSDFNLGALVHRGREGSRWAVRWQGGRVEASWGRRAHSRFGELEVEGLEALEGAKASFLPAKEPLSLLDAIRATREQVELAAFDDTYLDLYRDFQQPVPRGRLQDPIYEALELLGEATGGGSVDVDRDGRVWWQRGELRLAISQAAEGIRKAGVLHRLMRNRRIDPRRGGFLFVDEPEAHLHPRAEVLLAELLDGLARSGVQVFAATHSYFLLKRIEQLAREHGSEHALVSLRRGEGGEVLPRRSLLRGGLPPDDPVLAQSVALFETDLLLDAAEAEEG